MSYLTFLNQNGLVDGLIPAGKECPFKDTCVLSQGNWNGKIDLAPEKAPCKRPHCMDKNFSCASARGFSICKEMTKVKKEIKEK